MQQKTEGCVEHCKVPCMNLTPSKAAPHDSVHAVLQQALVLWGHERNGPVKGSVFAACRRWCWGDWNAISPCDLWEQLRQQQQQRIVIIKFHFWIIINVILFIFRWI